MFGSCQAMTKNDSECELAQSINVAHNSSETDDPVATCILLINKKMCSKILGHLK